MRDENPARLVEGKPLLATVIVDVLGEGEGGGGGGGEGGMTESTRGSMKA